jgi:uncharacterized OB-fold protein
VSPMAAEGLRLGKCSVCHARFVPVDGPCPRCGSVATESYLAPGLGVALATTALEVPPPGWETPHLLALVEVEDGVRLLVVPDPPLPEPGARLEVRTDGALYRARVLRDGQGGRGEGDAPGTGVSRPPFEPPR